MSENSNVQFSEREALLFHSSGRPGKIEIIASKPMATQRDLSLAYSPGVAVPVRAIAENPAYQGAQAGADGPALMRWAWALETETFALPAPDLQVYLETPVEVARGLIARKRQRSYTDQTYDQYEADAGLQARFAQVGDVLFQGSIGRTDFPRSDHASLLNAIVTKLWPLGDDVAFVPGHGPTSTFGAERRTNPFVSDEALRRAPIARPASGPS